MLSQLSYTPTSRIQGLFSPPENVRRIVIHFHALSNVCRIFSSIPMGYTNEAGGARVSEGMTDVGSFIQWIIGINGEKSGQIEVTEDFLVVVVFALLVEVEAFEAQLMEAVGADG